MKLQFASYRYRFAKALHSHQTFVIILGVLLVLLGVFLRINGLNSLPLDEAHLKQETEKIKPVRFNEEAIEQIKLLNDSNVDDPGTQLPGNRQNPFNE